MHKTKDYAPQTIKYVLALIKRIVNHGRYLGLTPGISFRVNMPQVHNTKTEDLDPDQLSRLLRAIEEDPNRAAAVIMKTALFTGMRRSEIFRLQWEDINFHQRTISIRAPKGKKTMNG